MTTTTTRTLAERIAHIRALPVFELAALADVEQPDAPFSPGGRWLADVRDQLAEHVETVGPDEAANGLHELADAAAPIYTHEAWTVFTDLGLWAELAPESDYSEAIVAAIQTGEAWRVPQIAAYAVAHRLASALLDRIGDQP